jgi:hypothetical protein
MVLSCRRRAASRLLSGLMAVTRQRLPLRLTGEPIAQRAKRGRRSAEVLAYLRARSDGAGYSELLTTFGEPGIKALDRLVSSGDVVRPQRARYVAAADRTRTSESAWRRE